MEPTPSLTSEPTQETILNKAIELIENSSIESDNKLDLVLLLLDRKQGIQLGNFQIAESEEEEKEVTEKFTKELSEILKILENLGLWNQVVKKVSDDNGIIGFSVLASKNRNVLKKFIEAHEKSDDKAFRTILGYPLTAVEAHGTDQAFDFRKELLPIELEELVEEGLMPFLLFSPSREHWAEELEWARENQRLIREKAPKLFEEFIE